MRTTFRGALAALTLIALGGCATEGVQTLTEAPTASAPPEVQEVLDVVNSDAGVRLLTAADDYEKQYCEVHLRRLLDTPEMAGCASIRDELGKLAGQLESGLKSKQPVPAELDERVSTTVYALSGLRVTAKPGEDPELLTFSIKTVRGALGAW